MSTAHIIELLILGWLLGLLTGLGYDTLWFWLTRRRRSDE